jgi:hypothetical protein
LSFFSGIQTNLIPAVHCNPSKKLGISIAIRAKKFFLASREIIPLVISI